MAFDARFTAQTVSTKDILKNNSSYLVPFLEELEAQLAILTRLEEFCSERPELIKTKKITSVMKVRFAHFRSPNAHPCNRSSTMRAS